MVEALSATINIEKFMNELLSIKTTIFTMKDPRRLLARIMTSV